MNGLSRYLPAAACLLALSLQACDPADEGNDPMDLNDMAVRYAAAWSSQDPDALAAFYADDGILQVNDGEPAIGRDAVRGTAEAFMTGFPDMTVELVELRGEYPNVEFHWHWTGTNTGPGGTGAYVDLLGYEAWTIGDDGLIVRSLGHYDEAEYDRQLKQ